ncbi:hypothetical protein D3C73_1616610 [compost metagenome]
MNALQHVTLILIRDCQHTFHAVEVVGLLIAQLADPVVEGEQIHGAVHGDTD